MNSNLAVCYRITNNINGKVYIGQTRDPIKRKLDHQRDAKYAADRYLYKSIRHHGWGNFSFEEIATCLSQDQNDIDLCEIELIQQYQSHNPLFGYNQTTGGKSGYSRSIETKKRISEKLKGREISATWRQKLSESGKGKHDTPHSGWFEKGRIYPPDTHNSIGTIPWNKGKITKRKLSDEQIRDLCNDTRPIKELKIIYGVGHSTISWYRKNGTNTIRD